jgi:hypothetical protein
LRTTIAPNSCDPWPIRKEIHCDICKVTIKEEEEEEKEEEE